VDENTRFAVGTDGMMNITFTDHGRGQFLKELLGLRHVRGTRIDGLVVRHVANQLIAENFPDIWLHGTANFNPLDFQRPDGGMAILPYASSDLELTVRLIPFIMDDVNTSALANYLWNIVNGTSAHNKMAALYGLAMMRQPVLLELEKYAMLENLSITNLAYLALGFAALGETHVAAEIYDERILPHIQAIAPYYRVYTGTRHSDIVQATSIVAQLASVLGKPERAGLHAYSMRHWTKDFNVHLERVAFISREIGQMNEAAASITYTLFGEEHTRQLQRWGFTLRIPAQNIHQFEIISVTGEVGAVSMHRKPLTEVEPADTGITVTRQFFRSGSNAPATTFNQGDLIRVEITIDYSAKDIQGSYRITDFLPAGLAHVPNSQRFGPRSWDGWTWTTAAGQAVTFFDHNSRFNNTRTYHYYARVISPGTFTAEGVMVQNLAASGYLTVGESTVITIKE